MQWGQEADEEGQSGEGEASGGVEPAEHGGKLTVVVGLVHGRTREE